MVFHTLPCSASFLWATASWMALINWVALLAVFTSVHRGTSTPLAFVRDLKSDGYVRLKHFISCKMPTMWRKPVHYINFSLLCCSVNSQSDVRKTLVCNCSVVFMITETWADRNVILFRCSLKICSVRLALRHIRLMEVHLLHTTTSSMFLRDYRWQTSLNCLHLYSSPSHIKARVACVYAGQACLTL